MTLILSLRFVEIPSKALTMLPDLRQRTKTIGSIEQTQTVKVANVLPQKDV